MFTTRLCVIHDLTTKNLIGVGESKRGVFICKDNPKAIIQVNKAITSELWHRRIGHPWSKALSKVSSNLQINFSKNTYDLCDVYLRVKQTCICFPISENKASQYFDLIHCDIWGVYHTKSFCGANYFLTILDDASRGVWTYLMKEKSEASQLVKNFITMVGTQFGTKVKVIRSEIGSEFTSEPMMKKFYGKHVIIFQISCVNTPQQNGMVE